MVAIEEFGTAENPIQIGEHSLHLEDYDNENEYSQDAFIEMWNEKMPISVSDLVLNLTKKLPPTTISIKNTMAKGDPQVVNGFAFEIKAKDEIELKGVKAFFHLDDRVIVDESDIYAENGNGVYAAINMVSQAVGLGMTRLQTEASGDSGAKSWTNMGAVPNRTGMMYEKGGKGSQEIPDKWEGYKIKLQARHDLLEEKGVFKECPEESAKIQEIINGDNEKRLWEIADIKTQVPAIEVVKDERFYREDPKTESEKIKVPTIGTLKLGKLMQLGEAMQYRASVRLDDPDVIARFKKCTKIDLSPTPINKMASALEGFDLSGITAAQSNTEPTKIKPSVEKTRSVP